MFVRMFVCVWGGHGSLEEVQGGGQQEGRQGSHTPVDPKGSADCITNTYHSIKHSPNNDRTHTMHASNGYYNTTRD